MSGAPIGAGPLTGARSFFVFTIPCPPCIHAHSVLQPQFTEMPRVAKRADRCWTLQYPRNSHARFGRFLRSLWYSIASTAGQERFSGFAAELGLGPWVWGHPGMRGNRELGTAHLARKENSGQKCVNLWYTLAVKNLPGAGPGAGEGLGGAGNRPR